MNQILKRLLFLLTILSLLSACTKTWPTSTVAVPPTATAVRGTPQPSATPQPSPTPTPTPEARLKLAEQAMLAGDYDQVLAQAQTVLAANGKPETQASALTYIGRIQWIQKNPNAALQSFSSVLERYPQSQAAAVAAFWSAKVLLENKSYPEAVGALNKYLTLRPGVLDAFIQEMRGDALLQMGDKAGAISAYNASLQSPRLNTKAPVEIKLGQTYASQGDPNNALRLFMAIYDSEDPEFYRSQANFLLGQTYLNMGLPEQAYARFQESLVKFPKYYDTYQGLVTLVNAKVPVDDLLRGIVNYHAKQYGISAEVLARYIKNNPQNHDGKPHYFRGLALVAQSHPEDAIAEWNELIRTHEATDPYWAMAWDEIAYTQAYVLNRYDVAVDTYQKFAAQVPNSPETPNFLYYAARLYETNNRLSEAAAIWEKLLTAYPTAERSWRAHFFAGITYYRLKNYAQAKTTFQRCLVLTTNADDQAAAQLWIGKVQTAMGETDAAAQSWEQCSQRDPTGYYSERCRELKLNRAPFATTGTFDLGYDLNKEYAEAEAWVRSHFTTDSKIDLKGPGSLAQDLRLRRGQAYWELGLYAEGRNEFEALRAELNKDPIGSFRLLQVLVDLGVYRSALLTSRQVLDLAAIDDAGTLKAPVYFNHIRFGVHYSSIVTQAAQSESLSPLLIEAVMRQESFYEGFAESGAGAIGAMQIMPATGSEIAGGLGWPNNYQQSDLLRPQVSIRFGASYLARWRNNLNGSLYAALAAYNGGPGNAHVWSDIAGGDPDLLLEVIRTEETRLYIMRIAEFFNFYRLIYARTL